MFSTQQIALRNQVAEIRSMLPEFDEEDRPEILEVIQGLVSQYEYTFPEEIWTLIKSFAISDISKWFWKSGIGKMTLTQLVGEYFQEPKNYLYTINSIEDIKVGNVVIIEIGFQRMLVKITKITDKAINFIDNNVGDEEICSTIDDGITYTLYEQSLEEFNPRKRNRMSISELREYGVCIVDKTKPLYIVR